MKLREVLSESTALTRLCARLFELMAGIALFLSRVGVSGVVSHAVVQRTPEMGLRMAWGSQNGHPSSRFFPRWQACNRRARCRFGALVDIEPLLASYLFGIDATDPSTLGAACGLLIIIAGGAISIPARRATRVDPSLPFAPNNDSLKPSETHRNSTGEKLETRFGARRARPDHAHSKAELRASFSLTKARNPAKNFRPVL
jgi:hypothetical protein